MPKLLMSALERCTPVAARRLRELRYCHLLATRNESWLRQAGWLRSCGAKQVVDVGGRPLPWMNYSAIELIRERLTKVQTLFEFGSGYSTLFYASLAADVTSVEHDGGWAKRVRLMLAEHDLQGEVTEVSATDASSYSQAIEPLNGAVDVVVIDGKHRSACARAAVACVKPSGVIVLDDSERPSLVECAEILRNAGFKQLRLSGIKPRSIQTHETSFFYRHNNCWYL